MTRVLMIEQGGRGGVADYTQQLVRALAAEGWRIDLATAQDHLFEPVDGVQVHAVFNYVRGHSPLARAVRRARLGPLANGLRFLASIPRLVRLARSCELTHSQGWEYLPLGLLATACMHLAGATVGQTTHNTFVRGRQQRRTEALLARLCAFTIVHTQADLPRVPRRRGDLVAVIPHGEYGALASAGGGVDRDGARAELGIGAQEPVTLLFGQLRPDKGLGELLAAALELPELRVLVGGREEGALAAAATLLGDPRLADRVIVREGFLEMAEAAKLFAAADTVALPYRQASQSGVLLLAYGFERPVVVYPVGGLVEAVVDGESGWVCARADAPALAAALAQAAAGGWRECRRRGLAGARLAHERYAWPVIARRTGELYRQALDAEDVG